MSAELPENHKKESGGFSNNETVVNISRILKFLRMSKVNLWCIPLSGFFTICQTIVVMYSTFLLFPLSQGVIANDFSHVSHLRGIRTIVQYFPWLSQSSTRLFIFLVLWIYFFAIIKNVFHYLAVKCSRVQGKLATAKIREILITKCLSYGKDFYDKRSISYLQSVLTKSTSLIEGQFSFFQNFISGILELTVLFIVMLHISWMLTLCVLILLPIITFITEKTVRNFKEASKEQQRVSIKLNEQIFNLLYCMPVIKSFVKEEEEIKKFSIASQAEIEQSFQMQKIKSLTAPIQDMGRMTGILLIAFLLASVLHSGSWIEASKAFVFFFLATRIMSKLTTFNHFKMSAVGANNAWDEIENILNQPDSCNILSGSQMFEGLTTGISFNNLTFKYNEEGPLVLDQINFSIEKNSVVAIVGPSGSGKTTLMTLLLRFYDCPPGSILIDGKDIREYNLQSLRKHIAFVSQDVLLFNDTVRNNIVYGAQEDVSEESLNTLADNMGISSFVDKMPEKYDTIVGERGGLLSGGEKQRLSIARAIIKDPEIIIMDEATSALDSITEGKINEFIAETCSEKTLIIIAHRLSTIKRADKVVYIDKGKVLESGTLKELIDKKGSFFKLWQMQKL